MTETIPVAPPATTTAPVAVQVYPQPTNKLAVGTTASASFGALLAGALAGYGNEALRNVLVEVIPSLAQKSATLDFLVFVLVTVAGFYGGKQLGLKAGWHVLDKPNVPLEPVAAPVAIPVTPETKTETIL